MASRTARVRASASAGCNMSTGVASLKVARCLRARDGGVSFVLSCARTACVALIRCPHFDHKKYRRDRYPDLSIVIIQINRYSSDQSTRKNPSVKLNNQKITPASGKPLEARLLTCGKATHLGPLQSI